MNLYLILYVTILLFSIQEVFYKNYFIYNYIIFLSFIFFWYIVGGRNGGTDFEGYKAYYFSAPSLANYFLSIRSFFDKFNSYVEFGFLLSASLSKAIGLSFQQFLAIFGLILSYLRLKAFKKATPYVLLALLVFASSSFIKDLGQIRNSMSAVLTLNAILAFEDSKHRKGYLYLFIAFLFHRFSLIAFIIPVLFKIHRNILYSIFGVVLVITLINPIGTHFAVLFTRVSFFNIESKISGYLSKEQYLEIGNLLSLGMLRTYLLILFLAFNYTYLSLKYKYFELLFKSYLVGIIFSILFNDFGIISYRARDLFGVGEPILFSYILGLYNGKNKILSYVIVIGFALLLFLNNYSSFSDYRHIFS